MENARFRASGFVAYSDYWRDVARSILNGKSIKSTRPKFAFRVPHNAKEDIEDPFQLRKYLTLVFEADTIEDKDKIFTAVAEMRMEFRVYPKVKYVMIECIDSRAERSIATHGVEFYEQEVLASWDLLHPTLRELLTKHNCQWILLELLRRGLFDEA